MVGGLEDLPSSVVLLTALGRSHEPLWSPVRLVWTLLDPPEPEVHRLAWRREKGEEEKMKEEESQLGSGSVNGSGGISISAGCLLRGQFHGRFPGR